MWERRTYTISASIGVVMIDDPSSTLKDLFAQADTACYMAKESGRNRIHLFSKDDDETSRRHGEMEWVNRLRWAIDEDRLLLYYQQLQPLKGDATASTSSCCCDCATKTAPWCCRAPSCPPQNATG